MPAKINTLILCSLILTVIPEYAFAYIGPGAGLSAIGTVLALIGVVLLAVLGFIWYPLKRFILKIKGKPDKQEEE